VLVLRLVREAIEALLMNCSVDTTPSPEYGFELLIRKRYDLLIVDYAMDHLDGAALYSLATKMFAIHPPEGRKMPPMLLMSGFASQPRAQEVLRSPGVRGLIAKPFSVDRLVQQVAQALEK
jgi:CheY-like chemotaxis protein